MKVKIKAVSPHLPTDMVLEVEEEKAENLVATGQYIFMVSDKPKKKKVKDGSHSSESTNRISASTDLR